MGIKCWCHSSDQGVPTPKQGKEEILDINDMPKEHPHCKQKRGKDGGKLIQAALTSITSMFSPRLAAQSNKDTPTKGHPHRSRIPHQGSELAQRFWYPHQGSVLSHSDSSWIAHQQSTPSHHSSLGISLQVSTQNNSDQSSESSSCSNMSSDIHDYSQKMKSELEKYKNNQRAKAG